MKPRQRNFKIIKKILIALAVFLFVVTVLLSGIIYLCLKSDTPESNFKTLFTDLSIGVPKYQVLHDFSRPPDAVKGDNCTADFSQSQAQFSEFLAHLKVSEQAVLSSSGVWITAQSKIDPTYTWMLLVHAHITNTPEKFYRVSIEGHQPYN